MKKNLLLIFVLSLMTILFAGCADDKGEPNIIYEKDDNTDTGTDIPENITYNITVTSVSNIDKTDNTSAWRFEPYSADDALEAVFADILGRPDSESDKTMIADINSSHLEGEYYKDAFGSGYYGNTYLNVMFRSSDYVDYGDAIYTITINNSSYPYINNYEILFNYVKEQILNNPYKNRYNHSKKQLNNQVIL